MAVEVRDAPAIVMPDTYGLPVYRVTKIIKQRVGDELHMLCGAEMFGQTQWSHICTMKLTDVLVEAQECEQIAMGVPAADANVRRADRH